MLEDFSGQMATSEKGGKMTKRKYPEIGNRIRIINPEFFVRCGYPMDLHEEKNRIYQDYGDQIQNFITQLIPPSWDGPYIDHTALEIAKALSYYSAKVNHFGGNERRIFTETHGGLKGKEFYVIGRKTVKTGTYVPGGRSGGYEYDEWEAPYLANEETHIILLLDKNRVPFFNSFEQMIEARNVEIVKEEE
jgi:hypothetical protein